MAYAQYTEVPVAKTRAEIERLLELHKAKQYGTAVDYDQCKARVQFRLHDRIVRFVIALPDRRKLGAQARTERTERQLFEQAFLSQIVMPNDQTVGDLVTPAIAEAYTSGRMPARLTAGELDE